MSDLRKAWGEIDCSPGRSGFVRLRLSAEFEPRIYAGRRRTDGSEALLLDIPTPALPPGFELPRAEGLDIGATAVEPGPAGRTCVHLALTEERYREVFAVLCEDVLSYIRVSRDDRESIERLVTRVDRWQTFLSTHGPDGLGPEAQRGLFGELWMLRMLLAADIAPSIVVPRWRGPDRDSHDFQLPAGSIEVKTTSAATPTVVRIANVKQLDDNGIPKLALFLLVVDESANAQTSLPELVAELRGRIDGAAREAFEDALFRVGYRDDQFEGHAPRRYTVRAERWLEVTSEFPRLLATDLPNGVVDVAYSISLAACEPFERTGREMLDQFVGMDDL